MLTSFLEAFFGCLHKNSSFPITPRNLEQRKKGSAALTGYYIVCLDCGKEFPYDWQHMRRVSAREIRASKQNSYVMYAETRPALR